MSIAALGNKLLQRYIEAHRNHKKTEHESLEKKRKRNEELEACRNELISELEKHGGEDVLENFVLQLPPMADDPDGKPLFLRLREHLSCGTVSLRGVTNAIYGTEEERANPDMDPHEKWVRSVDDGFRSFCEAEEAKKRKAAEAAAKKKKAAEKRRRDVARIKKMKEEEAEARAKAEAEGGEGTADPGKNGKNGKDGKPRKGGKAGKGGKTTRKRGAPRIEEPLVETTTPATVSQETTQETTLEHPTTSTSTTTPTSTAIPTPTTTRSSKRRKEAKAAEESP